MIGYQMSVMTKPTKMSELINIIKSNRRNSGSFFNPSKISSNTFFIPAPEKTTIARNIIILNKIIFKKKLNET